MIKRKFVDSPCLSNRLALRERPAGRSPVMFQKWRDLLFLHWVYEADQIQQTLPEGLYVDTFEGKAYLGIVPFFMKDVHPRFTPRVPGISNFMEMNVRTYVYDERGTAGVWFYSLDANQWLAVQMARKFFRLPYFYAQMHHRRERGSREIIYSSWRRGTDEGLRSNFRYQSRGAVTIAEADSLEFFLVERYVLFAYRESSRKLSTGRVYHRPYPIFEADVPVWDAHALQLDGFEKPERGPDHILMSPGVDVEVFALQ